MEEWCTAESLVYSVLSFGSAVQSLMLTPPSSSPAIITSRHLHDIIFILSKLTSVFILILLLILIYKFNGRN